MSDPSGFASSCVNDEDTQRTTEGGGEVDLRCPRNQETSSFGSQDAPSRVDATRVITWLKPVGKA